MINRIWNALGTWTALSEAFHGSRFSSRLKVNARRALLREKTETRNGTALQSLPGGFTIRKNKSDTGVVISMPLEYGIIEYNYSGRQQMTVVDVGANIGAFAYYLTSFMDVTSYVGIEAAPANFAILQTNLKMLGNQFQCLNVAASEKRMELEFDFGIVPSQFTRKAGGTKVQGIPLDEIDSIRDLAKIDLLKIDVEGGELDVVKGATETFSKTDVVVMEVHHQILNQTQVDEIKKIMSPRFNEVIYSTLGSGTLTNSIFIKRVQ